MKKFLTLSLLLFQLAAVGSALAHGGGWRDLPPEERRQMRQQMREQWQQERGMQRDDGAEERLRWRDLPPEDRRRMREEMRDQQGGWRNRPDDRGGRRD